MIAIGQEIKTHGLKATKYNGRLGIVMEILDNGRIKVRLEGIKKCICVLPSHLLEIQTQVRDVNVDDDTPLVSDKFALPNCCKDSNQVSPNQRAEHMQCMKKATGQVQGTISIVGLAQQYITTKTQYGLYLQRQKDGLANEDVMYSLKDVLDMPALLHTFDVWNNKWLDARQKLQPPHVVMGTPSTDQEKNYCYIRRSTVFEIPFEIAIKLRDGSDQAQAAIASGVLSTVESILDGSTFGGRWNTIVCDIRNTFPPDECQLVCFQKNGVETKVYVYHDDVPEELAADMMQVYFPTFNASNNSRLKSVLLNKFRGTIAKGVTKRNKKAISFNHNSHFDQFNLEFRKDLELLAPRQAMYAFGTETGEEHSQTAGWFLEMVTLLEHAISILHELCFYRCGCEALAKDEGRIVDQLLSLPYHAMLSSGVLLMITCGSRPHKGGLDLLQDTSVEGIYQAVVDTLGRLLNGLDEKIDVRSKMAQKILNATKFWNDMNRSPIHNVNKSVAQLFKLANVAVVKGDCKSWKSLYCMERQLVADNEKEAKERGVSRPSKFVKLKTCEHCGKKGKVGETLLMCGRCKNAAFCGKICQRNAWKLHKRECVKQKRAAATGNQLL